MERRRGSDRDQEEKRASRELIGLRSFPRQSESVKLLRVHESLYEFFVIGENTLHEACWCNLVFDGI